MSVDLSHRVTSIRPSATIAVTARAAELRAAGEDVIGLGAGEPDFDTPEHIKTAAIEAIHAGYTKYTAVDGAPELKQAVITKFQRDNALNYTPDNIIVSSGAKQCLFNLCQALLGDGDEVIVPSPYWVSYPDIATFCGARPVEVFAGPGQQFLITPEQLNDAITERTRLFVINSPCNPTGAVYPRSHLKALGEVLQAHPHVMIVADDIYEHIFWAEEPFCSFASANPALSARTVVVNGVSKAYAMTGWRIGYAAGPPELIAAMKKIQGQSTSNPSSVSQRAAVAALNGDQACITQMTAAFRERHDFVYSRLNEIRGCHCLPSEATFYSFPDMRLVIREHGLKDDTALAELLLEKAGVALVPGSAFGAPGFMRLSYATDMGTLRDAMDRLCKTLA